MMEYPREIANTITQFEDSFEKVDEFLKTYQTLGPGDFGKPNVFRATTADDRPDLPKPAVDEKCSPGSSKLNENEGTTGQIVADEVIQLENQPKTDRSSNEEQSSLDQAKQQLVDAYAINSIFWMYLCVQGVDPRSHIKHELERIRKYMNLIKEAADKQKAPKLNVKASKRLIRGAMFDTSESNKKVKKTNE